KMCANEALRSVEVSGLAPSANGEAILPWRTGRVRRDALGPMTQTTDVWPRGGPRVGHGESIPRRDDPGQRTVHRDRQGYSAPAGSPLLLGAMVQTRPSGGIECHIARHPASHGRQELTGPIR